MKEILLILLLPAGLCGQTVQLQYDMRKTVDPAHNSHNYPTLYYEYWKGTDSTSTLVKVQADLLSERYNMGKAYLQLAKSFRIYKKIQLHLSYSGGLGLTTPRQYSYTIYNTLQAGFLYPFQWNKAYLTFVADLKFIPYKRPSADPIVTLYWWRGLSNYKLELSGDFSFWTENKAPATDSSRGKRFYFFAEPQAWWRLHKKMFVGCRINTFYHVLTTRDDIQIYPSVGVRLTL